MTALLIEGGRLIDPIASLDAAFDVRIRDGIVVEIGERLTADGEERLDAAGAIVAPGFVDMHVHLREPGYPEKETIATGTQAAVRGGFTSVACMPNTNPALDTPAALADLQARVAEHARCRVYPIAAITLGRLGVQPCDFDALAGAGAVAFSDDGDTVADARVLRDAALLARNVSGAFISHCDDPAFNDPDGNPPIAEELIVARDLLVAAATDKRWHVAHLTTRRALDLVRWARARGTPVTCEVTPHHLTFTRASAQAMGAGARVNPPLRTDDDVQALRSGVWDGSVDALASDHAPHTVQEKRATPAAPGFSGLEVAVGAYAAALEGLPVARFVELLSSNPARILRIPGGSLRVGQPGDVTIFADRSWVVDPTHFASKGTCTPFAGRRLPRQVLATVVGGDVRYRAAEFVR